jgi:hypothetical protein
MQGFTKAPDFEEFLARYEGQPCALQRATADYEAAWRDFYAWEAQRLREVTPTVPR